MRSFVLEQNVSDKLVTTVGHAGLSGRTVL